MTTQQKLGLIQSRGIGDIVIALPIARWYNNEGYDIYWPICEEFVSNVKDTVPWVNWIPIAKDHGAFFYDVPMQKFNELGIENFICLYQSLTAHTELSSRPEFQITKFDQLKYHAAQVPFLEKWNLSECITRDPEREQKLRNQLDIRDNEPYVVVHLEGSDHRASYDPAWIPSGWRIIEVGTLTDSVFDWIGILENAQAIVAVDSIISNLVDQLGINNVVDSYFIPRSHIHLTPVLGGPWTTLDPGADVLKRISIFRSN